MKFNEIQEIIYLLNIENAARFSLIEIDQDKDTNRIYPSPDSHTLINLQLKQAENDTWLKNIIDSLNDYTGLVWLIKEKDEWIAYSSPAELAHGASDNQNFGYLYVPPQTGKMDTARFVEQIAHLRSPEGCPWDRKQTHQSLRTNLLEETYEVLEAIDARDNAHLQEELGDLLLQIVLHAQIAKDEKSFDFGNVVHDVYQKIRNRHPHVFKDTKIEGVSDVLSNWEKIKAEERKQKNDPSKTSILTSIPEQLPSLSLAQKYQERAARVGFDWEDISPVYKKVFEEIEEVRNADSQEGLEEELGDLLFAVVNLVRWSGFDAEAALRLANHKFRRRFQFIEKKISDNNLSITEVSLSEMDALWDRAKLDEH
jgi:tetrapyrrole methylase family protein/MazG family protein